MQIQVVGLHSPQLTPDQLSGAVLQAVEALEQAGHTVQGRCTCQLDQLAQAISPTLAQGQAAVVLGGACIDPAVRRALEGWLKLPWVFDPATDRRVRAAYEKAGRQLPPAAQLLARFPQGATILPGVRSILPGCAFPALGGVLALLPARPEEFLPMLQRGLLPLWQAPQARPEPQPAPTGCSRLVNAWGVSEAALAQKLADLSPPEGVSLQVVPLPGGLGVRVDCDGTQEHPQAVCQLVSQQVSLTLGEAACGFDQQAGPAGVVAEALFAAGQSVALGESGTNGLLAGQLQALPNAGKVLPFAVSAYSHRLRRDALLVPERLLKKYGPTSSQAAAAMALGAMQQGGASLGLAVCCPSGEETGPCWAALCDGESVWTRQQELPGRREDPEAARLLACQAGLRLVLDYLAQPDGLPGGQSHRAAVEGMLPTARAAKSAPAPQEEPRRGRGVLRVVGILLVLAGLGAAGWLGVTQGLPLWERLQAASAAASAAPQVEAQAAQALAQAQDLSGQAQLARQQAAQAALDAQHTISPQKAQQAANQATRLCQQLQALYGQARQVRDQAEALFQTDEGEATMTAYEAAQRALKATKQCLDEAQEQAAVAQTAALGVDLAAATLAQARGRATPAPAGEADASQPEDSSAAAQSAAQAAASSQAAASLAAAQAASQAAAQAAASSQAAALAAQQAAAAQAASQAAASRAEVASRIAAEQAAIRQEALEAQAWEEAWEQAEEDEEEENWEDEEFQPSGSGDDQLTIYANGRRTTGDATDIVAMVVMNEMGSSFQMEALKAQAVAVYTYICHQNAGGVTPSFNTRTPNATVQRAVDAVAGQAVYYRGALAFTPFFATSAGVTVSSAEVWGGSYPYLVSVDSEIDEQARNYEVEVTLDADTVADRVDRAMDVDLWDYSGDPDDWFEIEDYTEGGSYVARIRVGDEVVSGRYLRENVLGLRSAAFDIDCDGEEFTFTTYGYGHGVGMSQTGADLYASEEGWDYVDILTHYYPGTQVG